VHGDAIIAAVNGRYRRFDSFDRNRAVRKAPASNQGGIFRAGGAVPCIVRTVPVTERVTVVSVSMNSLRNLTPDTSARRR
jgi:hypothetical protein